MFKVCLIQPPIEDFYTTSIRNIPLGLLSIGATINKYKVILLDLRNFKPKKISPPKELQDVLPYYKKDDASPFSLYKSFYRFGAFDEEIKQLIPKDFDIFCISSLFTTYSSNIHRIIHLIREITPGSKIIIGGSHASILPGDLLDAGADFAVIGEGEKTLLLLLNEFQKTNPDYSTVPNLVWRTNNKIIKNPIQYIEKLDNLPFPDYSIPGTPEYKIKGKRHAMIITSRGCPYRCNFCCIHHTMGYKYRVRSVENILAELEDKIEKGFRSFDFEDDHFGGNRKWLNQLLDNIIERFSKFDLSLQAMNGITASNLDQNILFKMRKAGFSTLNLSLVSPSKTKQKMLNRPFGTEKFISIVKDAQKSGMFVTAYLIIGLPGDTIKENFYSILFLSSLPCLIAPSLFYLVPGTLTFSDVQKQNKIPLSRLCYRSSYFPYSTLDFDRTAAMTLFRICRIINFLKEVIDFGYSPSGYSIDSDRIVIKKGLSGKQNRISLGFALLELSFKTGKIYGTGKKTKDYYPLFEEKCSTEVLELFFNSSWDAHGPRSGKILKKANLSRLLSL